MPPTAPWVEHRPSSRRWPRMQFGLLWRYREVALFLAWRDVKLRYRQTVLGVGWVLLQPIASAAVFAFTLGNLAHVPSDGLPYTVFVFAGLVAWNYLAATVQNGAASLVDARQLVTRLYFPRLLAPLAAVLAGTVDLLIALGGLAIVLVVSGTGLGPQVLLLPLWLIALGLLAFGTSALLAAVNARYRDVRYALPFLLQFWLFASPVIYPASLVRHGARWAFALNPLVGLLDGIRWSAVGGPAPVAADAVSLATGVVLIATGLSYFRRAESQMADVI